MKTQKTAPKGAAAELFKQVGGVSSESKSITARMKADMEEDAV